MLVEISTHSTQCSDCLLDHVFWIHATKDDSQITGRAHLLLGVVDSLQHLDHQGLDRLISDYRLVD